MMKRWIAGALVWMMLLSCVVGCGGTEAVESTTQTKATDPVSTSEVTEATEAVTVETEQPSMQAEANFDSDINILCWGKTSDK